MKLLKITFAAAIALSFSSAYAFHSGGVAECEGCHSMHSPAAGGSFLLVGRDQSSACLTCHGQPDTAPNSYHVLSLGGPTAIPVERTPGGDFAWLQRSYTYTASGATTTEAGQVHGHNVVALDRGLVADTDNTTSPGGSFPAASLACNSCHDPHGKFRRLADGTVSNTGAAIWASGSYPGTNNEPKTSGEAVGVYRLLAGNGYATQALGTIGFPGVPAAKVPSNYNVSEATTQIRVAYGVGTTAGHTTWANWCATCHAGMHSSGNYVHPTDQALGTTIAGLYNSYVKSGDLTGTVASSFSSLAPFTTASGDYTVLGGLTAPGNAPGGPTANDQVNCMSCHRAHASGFAEMLRFDNGYEFMVKNGQYIGSDNPAVGTTGRGPLQSRGRTIADWQASYYDRPATQFATYQRVFCNKCHAKD